ncbi:methyltransferase domain-containing protein [Flavobacterium weaverense]|uniref:Thiopurine S-methyltransferase n=1 Tax=Flavobacterium weaverense TaxID=271156 RepID=A0A3L9ZJD1_9FLAO|nr:methyltransferase domain-containing protein [Flavobacterium weaverense]RMA72494.1 thiopurine S-methyltransferase [Flavobacterium weaverense]
MDNNKCCTNSKENKLDADYWDDQYKAKNTGWDLGTVSPPIKSYFNTLKDKNIAILIPGCGNTYEAEYLLDKGFTNITIIDIAPTLVQELKNKFDNNKSIKIILGDFFLHNGKYDLIIEQTFFCALSPHLRENYVLKMHQLLSQQGILAGLLFNRTFEIGPPFGGNKEEYRELFKYYFEFLNFDQCYNSFGPRTDSELFFEFKKRVIR